MKKYIAFSVLSRENLNTIKYHIFLITNYYFFVISGENSSGDGKKLMKKNHLRHKNFLV